jgi:hypothetical protein
MSKAMNILRVMSAGLLSVMLLASCTSTKKVTAVGPQQICSEITTERLSSMTDSELSGLLDDTDDGNGLDDCWILLVKTSLDDGRYIPRKHLVKAVRIFNKRQHEQYFHKTLYRYFTVIAENPGSYRPEDRKLLYSYCSYLINNAESSRDKYLRLTKQFCRKLDRNLYTRLFG